VSHRGKCDIISILNSANCSWSEPGLDHRLRLQLTFLTVFFKAAANLFASF
jgi:hypothetical protein